MLWTSRTERLAILDETYGSNQKHPEEDEPARHLQTSQGIVSDAEPTVEPCGQVYASRPLRPLGGRPCERSRCRRLEAYPRPKRPLQSATRSCTTSGRSCRSDNGSLNSERNTASMSASSRNAAHRSAVRSAVGNMQTAESIVDSTGARRRHER
mgnify:CR=1 FL=1